MVENRENLSKLKSKTIWGRISSGITIAVEIVLWCALHSYYSLEVMFVIMGCLYLFCKMLNTIENGTGIGRIRKKKRLQSCIEKLENKRPELEKELQRMKEVTGYQAHHESEIDWTNNPEAKYKFTGVSMNHDEGYKVTEAKVLHLTK